MRRKRKESHHPKVKEKEINELSEADRILLGNDFNINKSYYVSVKTRLLPLLRNIYLPLEEFGKSFKDILDDAISRINKIIFHTYGSLKAYYLKKLDNNEKNIIFKMQFIRDIMNIATIKRQNKGKKPKITDFTIDFQKFFDEYYKPILEEEDLICRDNLKHLLNAEEDIILINISNNIKEHFFDHLKFVILLSFGFKKEMDKLRKSEKTAELRKLNDIFYGIYKDIINIDKKDNKILSDQQYHEKIILFRDTLIPIKDSFEEVEVIEENGNKILKENIFLDLEKNPFDYFPQMVEMNRIIEEFNNNIIENHNNPNKKPSIHKLFNALPLRTSIVPKHITIDTPSLISLFTKKGQAGYMKRESDPIFRKHFWNKFFKLDSKAFKRKGYKFAYVIKTDGVSCSLLFIKMNKQGIPIVQPSGSEENKQKEEAKKVPYIDEVHITPLMRLKEVVTIDPNKNEMISAMKEKHNDGCDGCHCKHFECPKYIYFNYTRGQRDKDRRKKRADKKRKELLKTKIGNKTVEEIQGELACYNHKTCDFNNFLEYQKKKIEINRLLNDHYSQEIYRELNLRNHINIQRSESLMINRFKEKMGTPDKVIIVLGDYSDNGLRGTPPSITLKIRKLFKDAGYDVFLIDEYLTSKTCPCCENKVKQFTEIKRNKKEWHEEKNLRKEFRKKAKKLISRILNNEDIIKGKEKTKIIKEKEIIATSKRILLDGMKRLSELELTTILKETKTSDKKSSKKIYRWKLLRCTSCSAIHNRDHNATKNMLKITKSIMKGKGRPSAYQRPKKIKAGEDSVLVTLA